MSFDFSGESVWEKLQNTNEPIIMYGTGNGADKVLDVFESLGIKLCGIMASDGFVRSRSFRGFQVYPLSYFEEKYSSFTVIVTFGTSRPEVMNNIYNISKKHRLLVPAVPVIGTEIFDRKFIEENEFYLKKAREILADDYSREIYDGYVNFLFGGELSDLKSITTPEGEAFETVLKLNESENYIDIGAYRGDTVDKFLSYTNNNYNKIICAEPDTKSFNKLQENCGELKGFRAHNVAVGNTDTLVGFSDLHGRQSAIGGDKLTRMMSLKTLCADTIPTYIKIDSEGCECAIINGASDIFAVHKPKLNIAAYHKFTDIFNIPVILYCYNKDYKIHLRHHPYIPGWDTLFYCV